MSEYKPVAPKPLSEVGSKTTFTTKSTSGGEKLKGGKADNKSDKEFDPEQLKLGIKVESEHTSDPEEAKEVAKDHLTEIPDYYKRLTVMEAKAEKEIKKSFERANSLVKAMKESIDEKEMDLKKNKDEEDEKPSVVSKSFGYIGQLVKALKASDIAGLSRRERLGVAYQAGMAAGRRQPPFAVEPADLSGKLDVGIAPDRVSPDHEPPAVPIRTVATPFEIPPKKCEDHKYSVAKATPAESLPFWRR